MSDDTVHANVFEHSNEDPPKEYIDLYEVISLEGVKYDSYYRMQELEILQPRLEAIGYTDIKWFPGETDSFGPLTRTCRAKNPGGETVWFVYG